MNKELTSKDFRKYAEEIREFSRKVKDAKKIKCAKYVVGLTALAQLKDKLKSL